MTLEENLQTVHDTVRRIHAETDVIVKFVSIKSESTWLYLARAGDGAKVVALLGGEWRTLSPRFTYGSTTDPVIYLSDPALSPRFTYGSTTDPVIYLSDPAPSRCGCGAACDHEDAS